MFLLVYNRVFKSFILVLIESQKFNSLAIHVSNEKPQLFCHDFSDFMANR